MRPVCRVNAQPRRIQFMAKMITKSATIAAIAQKANLSKKQVAEVMDDLVGLATKEAKNGFVLPGFGKLVLANRKAHMVRKPQTVKLLKITDKREHKFLNANA